MRIGFLLGAGVSLPVGTPSTQQLTDAVFRVDDYTLHTDGSFGKAVAGVLGDWSWQATRPLVELLLQSLNQRCQYYFDAEKGFRTANYEDVFFAASQLYEHLRQEYENPAIEPFAEAVLKGMPQLDGRKRLMELAGTACDYISDVVAIELSRNPTQPRHVKCLVDAMRDQDFEGCDIFTLNHDKLIEKELGNARLPFVDGFRVPDGEVAWWAPQSFGQDSLHYFLKLHGSINWVEYNRRLAKTLSFDRNHAHTADGGMLSIPGRQRVLVGTFNKIRDYFGRPFFDLWATFRRQMARISCLIVSGYSFRDKGVNWAISEWMDESPQSKLLVLHANGDQCLKTARGAIRNLCRQYAGTRMLIHPSHLNACDWPSLRQQYQIC